MFINSDWQDPPQTVDLGNWRGKWPLSLHQVKPGWNSVCALKFISSLKTREEMCSLEETQYVSSALRVQGFRTTPGKCVVAISVIWDSFYTEHTFKRPTMLLKALIQMFQKFLIMNEIQMHAWASLVLPGPHFPKAQASIICLQLQAASLGLRPGVFCHDLPLGSIPPHSPPTSLYSE